MPIRQAVIWVRDVAFDLWQILHHPMQTKPRMEQPRWARPERGWIKCNVDAAFHAETGRGATGGVLRDDEGRFLEAQAIAYNHCMDALMAEAYICLQGWYGPGRETWCYSSMSRD
jgi:hypothetical protein